MGPGLVLLAEPWMGSAGPWKFWEWTSIAAPFHCWLLLTLSYSRKRCNFTQELGCPAGEFAWKILFLISLTEGNSRAAATSLSPHSPSLPCAQENSPFPTSRLSGHPFPSISPPSGNRRSAWNRCSLDGEAAVIWGSGSDSAQSRQVGLPPAPLLAPSSDLKSM